MTTEKAYQFNFETPFDIRPCQDGGFLIQQGSPFDDKPKFNRAYTTIGEVIAFLIEQKRRLYPTLNEADHSEFIKVARGGI